MTSRATERRTASMDFSNFLDERQTALLRLAVVLCGSRAAGEDVLQDVLLRAYQLWPRIGVLASPYGYVRTMLVHEHLAWRQRSRRHVPTEVVDLAPGPDHAERIVVRDELLRRIERLPDRQRTAVVLRYFDDLDDADIAAALGCAQVTVRSQISRALRTLRSDVPAEPSQGEN